ncbi:DUF3885 domain-containing protein [Candidatus Bodocaedibacter vickermanii]|uniref:DUF3885 domain-containing protein n=1 Tax=Candidatus Bodocaedibacter vickermanii TaxID=2741701 RepID=A0A7L9RUE6_9PROT|nr:hypothetical protein CPBP_00963 [Candidatus Paracaedibacteraceae bacterium 'Lake Konstanz']
MSKIEEIVILLPNIFKSASFYKNEYALRVLLEDTSFSPYSLFQSIHRAKDILLSMFLNDSDIYYIKVRRMNDISRLEVFNDDVNDSEYLEKIVKPYEKFEEDFEDFGCVYAQYSMYKAKKTEKIIIDLLWDPLATTFHESLSFTTENDYEIYFISPDNVWSFYPYDNRGADIICKDLTTYRETYKKLEPYLFEHDIELMKKRLQY